MKQGVARIFQKRGGGGSHCVTPRVLTRLSCRHLRCVLLKVSSSKTRGGGGGESRAPHALGPIMSAESCLENPSLHSALKSATRSLHKATVYPAKWRGIYRLILMSLFHFRFFGSAPPAHPDFYTVASCHASVARNIGLDRGGSRKLRKGGGGDKSWRELNLAPYPQHMNISKDGCLQN